VTAIERSLPPGIFVVGNAYRGVGVADTVRNANEVAGRVRAHLAGDERSSEREHVR
jgi:protoporphyrinogen oxidase